MTTRIAPRVPGAPALVAAVSLFGALVACGGDPAFNNQTTELNPDRATASSGAPPGGDSLGTEADSARRGVGEARGEADEGSGGGGNAAMPSIGEPDDPAGGTGAVADASGGSGGDVMTNLGTPPGDNGGAQIEGNGTQGGGAASEQPEPADPSTAPPTVVPTAWPAARPTITPTPVGTRAPKPEPVNTPPPDSMQMDLRFSQLRGSASYTNCLAVRVNGGAEVHLGCNKDGTLAKDVRVLASPSVCNMISLKYTTNLAVLADTSRMAGTDRLRFDEVSAVAVEIGYEDGTDFDFNDYIARIGLPAGIRYFIEGTTVGNCD